MADIWGKNIIFLFSGGGACRAWRGNFPTTQYVKKFPASSSEPILDGFTNFASNTRLLGWLNSQKPVCWTWVNETHKFTETSPPGTFSGSKRRISALGNMLIWDFADWAEA